MSKQAINIVWLKRDLRTQDHEPFKNAENSKLPTLVVYILDPKVIFSQGRSLRHLQFIYKSLTELQKKIPIQILYGDTQEIFEKFSKEQAIANIFSYQEIGTKNTFSIDLNLKEFCKQNKINWQEYQYSGIIRGKQNRINWDKDWFETTFKPITKNNLEQINTDAKTELVQKFKIPCELLEQIQIYPKDFQPAGENTAHKYLQSFLETRFQTYSKHISLPSESRKSCTRLSAYLAWGNLSTKQVYQSLSKMYLQTKNRNLLNAMIRIRWRDHFIQKFETDINYQDQNINKAYNKFKWQNNQALLQAWKQGKTGIPIIDANMVCLIQTGWINFRMRAMLVSFLCQYLMQDWKQGAEHLAELFLDYEPGIHFPQFQMQAGTTGINTLRIYNPIKQSKEKDPQSTFIKKWIPELLSLPVEHVHEPHKIPELEKLLFTEEFIHLNEYPKPIINYEQEIKNNRPLFWEFKKSKSVKAQSKKIIGRLTR